MKQISLFLSFALFIGFNSNAQQYIEHAIALGVNHKHVDFNQMGGGVAIFDLNKDGYEDLYLTGGDEPDKLYINNGDGSFTDISGSSGIASIAGIRTVGVTTGDIDNDGDRDIFVTTFRTNHNILFLNNGDNTFTDISISAGITDSVWSSSVTMGDYNKDGLLDIYVANYADYASNPFYSSISGGITNTLYLNNGDLTFSDVTVSTGTGNIGTGLAVAFTDFDQDADVDLLVGNDFGYNYEPNALYQNNYPADNFSNIAVSSFTDFEIDAMGIAIGDIDEDGDFDYYISNMMENLLHVKNSGLDFSESASAALIQVDSLVSWGTFFFDYDNDTYLDLFVANGGVMMVTDPQQNVLFQNLQNGTFQNIALSVGVDSIRRSRGAAYGDFNNDGILEIVVVNVGPNLSTSFETSIYQDTLPNSNHWVAFELNTYCNADAFGAHINLYSNGRSWVREIGGGSSYLSQNSSRVHFGLGTYTSIDSVVINWPDGVSEMYMNPPIDQIIGIIQQAGGISGLAIESMITIYPNPASTSFSIQNSSGVEIKSILFYDNFGRNLPLIQTNTIGNIISYDTSTLSSGIYTLQIITASGITMKRIELLR